ncbi:ABC transporter G family protein [Pelomyxa schiedti]|nr:ABC transporter G family protein [Pelomyxa schiedti]
MSDNDSGNERSPVPKRKHAKKEKSKSRSSSSSSSSSKRAKTADVKMEKLSHKEEDDAKASSDPNKEEECSLAPKKAKHAANPPSDDDNGSGSSSSESRHHHRRHHRRHGHSKKEKALPAPAPTTHPLVTADTLKALAETRALELEMSSVLQGSNTLGNALAFVATTAKPKRKMVALPANLDLGGGSTLRTTTITSTTVLKAAVENMSLHTEFVVPKEDLEAAEASAKKGLSVSFSGITYTVPIKGKDINILKGLSAYLPSGKLIALMGPSGCGKSTLLDILAGKNKTGKIGGSVLIDGIKPSPSVYLNHTAYVMQDDIFIPELTPKELLDYRIKLKLPDMIPAERSALISLLLQNFNLQKVANTRVGGEKKRGLSGGERRRLTIALEVVNSPQLLFIDEVTSGLDAQNAFQVIKAVQKFVENGSTAICTIHQPRSQIFELFDYLLLLADGRLIFYGPVKDVLPYFKSLEITPPPNENLADFVIDLLSSRPAATVETPTGGDTGTLELKHNTAINLVALSQKYTESAYLKYTVAPATTANPSWLSEKAQRGKKKQILQSFWYLILRNWLVSLRNVKAFWLQMISSLVIGLIAGGLYWDLPRDPDATSAGQRMGALTFALIAFSIMIMNSIGIIIDSRILYFREHGAGLYTSGAYFLANMCVQVPICFLDAILCAIPFYWMAFGDGGTVNYGGVFFAICLLAALLAWCWAELICLFSASTNEATAIYVGFLLAMTLLSGSQIMPGDVSYGGLFRVSYMNYLFEPFVVNEFAKEKNVMASESGEIPPSIYFDAFVNACGYKEHMLKWDLLICAGLFIVLRVAIYLIGRFVRTEKR